MLGYAAPAQFGSPFSERAIFRHGRCWSAILFDVAAAATRLSLAILGFAHALYRIDARAARRRSIAA